MKVIGVVGLNGSGKDEVVKYLNARYGVPLISIGDIVREIASQENIEPTRDNLDEITRRYFEQFGKGYFLKLVVEKIRHNQWKFAGVSGIRSPEDVRIMREAFPEEFILVHVYITDNTIRYERMRQRGSKRDGMTFTDFLNQDKVSEEIFQINEAIDMADYSIPNNGTLEDLHRQIDRLVVDRQLL